MSKPSSHQPSRTLKFGTPFWAAFIPDVPDASSGRRGLLSQTSTPCTRKRADLHVVVLEDVDPAAELGRPRALEDLLDDPLAGSVGRMGLAREHDLDRALLVPQHARQPLDVAEQQPGPLVGREAAREADGQDVRIERGLELGEHRRRLAVTRELAAQPPAREMGELALLAEMRVPQVARGDPVDAFPEPAALGAGIEIVEVRPDALEQLGDRIADPGRPVDAVGDAKDRPIHHLGPRLVGGLGVQVADRVGAVGQAQ